MLTAQVYMLQYLTPSVLMTLLKVQQGDMIEIAGEYFNLEGQLICTN